MYTNLSEVYILFKVVQTKFRHPRQFRDRGLQRNEGFGCAKQVVGLRWIN